MINGETAVFGLIGQHVEYSHSPFIHNTLAGLTGINSVYSGFPVREPASLGAAISGAHSMGIKGLNITVPYKISALPFLKEIHKDAERVGAVNTLKSTENGYSGYNTDVYGVLKALEKHDVSFGTQSVLIVGAGGAAAAAAFAAVKRGAGRIYIVNRTNNNAELLASRLKKYYNDLEVYSIATSELSSIKDDYFIIQATSVGMKEYLSPLETEYVANSTGVFDVIYAPAQTKILQDAKNFGKQFINGLDMLIYQAIGSFEIWNNIRVEERVVEELSTRVFKYINSKME